MIKNLLRELVLPSFWLFFLIVSNHSERTPASGTQNAGLPGKENQINKSAPVDKNTGERFIKVIYLPELNR